MFGEVGRRDDGGAEGGERPLSSGGVSSAANLSSVVAVNIA